MNYNRYVFIVGAFLLGMLSAPAYAALDESGFSGEASLLLGFSYQKSNFNTDKKRINTLNSSGESDTQFLPLPLAELRYTFGHSNQHQVFIGTSRTDIGIGNFIFEAGYAYEIAPYSSVEFSYLPDLIQNETFSDPFLTDESRDKTDTSGHALRFKYLGIAQSNFNLDVAYYTHRLDSEKSAKSLVTIEEQKSLNREGEGFYSKLSYMWALSRQTRIVPSVIYQSFDADGSAMTHYNLGMEASLIHTLNRHRFVLTGGYQYADFDKANPVFDETQRNDKYKLFLAYEYDQLMGWDNWAFSMLAGYTQTHSNINFYNQKSAIAGAGVSYKF